MIEETKKPIEKNFLISISVTIIIGLVNIGFPLLIGLLYGPEIMGGFSVLFYYSTLVSIPIANGIAPAISRFIAAGGKCQKNQIENTGLKLTFNYIVFFLFLLTILGFTVLDFIIWDILVIQLLIIFTVLHHIFRKSLQGQERFSFLLKNELFSFLIFLPLMLIFSVLPKVLNWSNVNNFYLLFLPMIFYHFTFSLIFLVKKLQKLKLRNIYKFPPITKKILKYSLFIGLGSIFGLGTSQIQIIISSKYISEFELGVLSFWNSALTPIALVAITLTAILVPRITNLLHSKAELVIPFINKMNYSLTLIIYPFIGFLYLIIELFPNFLDYITFSKYQMETYWLVPILIGLQVTNSLLSSISISYFSSSEKYIILNPIASFFYSISVISTWLILVPKYGIYGFAGGLAIGGFVFYILIQIFILIITKGKVGKYLLLTISLYLLNTFCLVIHLIWSSFAGLIIWSVILCISLAFGVFVLTKIIKNKDYSFNFTSSEFKENKEQLID